jgi:hypothetical protein
MHSTAWKASLGIKIILLANGSRTVMRRTVAELRKGGRLRIGRSASGASSRIGPGVGFLWVRW